MLKQLAPLDPVVKQLNSLDAAFQDRQSCAAKIVGLLQQVLSNDFPVSLRWLHPVGGVNELAKEREELARANSRLSATRREFNAEDLRGAMAGAEATALFRELSTSLRVPEINETFLECGRLT
eukprot:SAG11_NODE_845_length_6885_cov_6.782346_4_plen_123_part_00